MVVPIYSEIPVFYRQKPRGERREKIGGANAPLTNTKRQRKRDFGRVFAAMVWPGGHIRLGQLPRLKIFPYLLLVFPFLLQDLTKQPLIISFNRLIWDDSFQPVFNLSDLSRSALIPYFEVILN